jgi:hypothetical protein
MNKLNKKFLELYFIVKPRSIIIPSFTVLNYALAKLVGPASWQMLDPYIKNIYAKITPCHRLHNIWTEWRFLGSGSESVGKELTAQKVH